LSRQIELDRCAVTRSGFLPQGPHQLQPQQALPDIA